MAAHERSTDFTHSSNPAQQDYDWLYYRYLMPHITGKVLDIGAGYLQFVKEYAKKDDVTSILCLDKFTEEAHAVEKATRKEWICPEILPEGKFDTIVSTEFVEHIVREQFEPLLEQIVTRLTDDGKFVGSTPNKMFPTTNPYHLYEYTKGELEEILKKYFSRVTVDLSRVDCTLLIAQK